MSRAAGRLRHLARQPWYVAAAAVVFATLALVAANPAGAEGGALRVSEQPGRGGSTPLDGATVSGNAYVFLATADDVQRVIFSLDGAETTVENYLPYDFAGGSGGQANPWSTESVADGTHTITAEVQLVGGGSFTASASFTVSNAVTSADAGDAGSAGAAVSLMVSGAQNRGGASALDGSTLSGDAYVFVSGDDVDRVVFSLDGATKQTENGAPWDFAGTANNGTANAWDTSTVSDGSHTIAAQVWFNNGSSSNVAASFEVAQGAGGEPTATPTVTETPQEATGSLLVSSSPSRSDGSALGASALSGDAYVFVRSSAQLDMVRFSLDGEPRNTERVVPWDFAGTANNGSANPWDTTRVADGPHTIEATVTTTDGYRFVLSGSVVIDNNPLEAGSSEIDTTTSSTDAGDPTIGVFVSASSDRSAAQMLGEDALTGEVYVFAVPSVKPARVRFYIDPDEQPLPVRTESAVPYDLGGTRNDGSAGGFDTGALDSGTHVLLVVAEYADGTSVAETVPFEVEHPAVLPTTGYELMVSESANRSGASTLSGETLTADEAYVFVSPVDYAESVAFYLDDASQSSADRVDSVAPFDLVGGSASTAQPLDVTALESGSHSLVAVITRTNGESVEAQATFSAGDATLPDGSILIRTTDNAAKIASQHPAGTVFVFESGLHRGVSLTPQSGDVFLGEAGAILSGAKVLSNWSAGSGFWYAGGQTSQLTPHGGCIYLEDGSRYYGCQYPEQLFVDGESWWQVTKLSDLGYGKWYFDYGADRVYVGTNPSGHTIELSTVPQAFSGSASDVTISGLVIEKYANRAQTGAIQGSSSNRWTVSNNELRYNHGVGLRVGNRMRALNNYVHHNGQLGIGGVGSDILVEGNEISYNNTAGFLEDWEAGGTKFAVTSGLVVRNNWVHHNEGRGLWTDIDNINALIEDNLTEYNAKSGIAHEISYDAVIRNNVSRYNGHGFDEWVWGAQILVQNSPNVVVTGNEVTVAASYGNGITIVNQNRGSGRYGPYVSENVTVTHNTIRHLGGAGREGSPSGCSLNNTFDYNTYIATNYWWTTYRRFEWCGVKYWGEYREAGLEAHGERVVSN
jgi:hypothetical protein